MTALPASYDDYRLDNGEAVSAEPEPLCIEDRIAEAIAGDGVDDISSVRFDANGGLFADVSLCQGGGLSDGEKLRGLADDLRAMAGRLESLGWRVK